MEDNNDMIKSILNVSIPSNKIKSKLLELVDKRLDFGKEKYGHGVRVFSDVNEYNTNWNDKVRDMSWHDMFLEEALDGMVYIADLFFRTNRSFCEGFVGGRP